MNKGIEKKGENWRDLRGEWGIEKKGGSWRDLRGEWGYRKERRELGRPME